MEGGVVVVEVVRMEKILCDDATTAQHHRRLLYFSNYAHTNPRPDTAIASSDCAGLQLTGPRR
jgi:hypothetical protein